MTRLAFVEAPSIAPEQGADHRAQGAELAATLQALREATRRMEVHVEQMRAAGRLFDQAMVNAAVAFARLGAALMRSPI